MNEVVAADWRLRLLVFAIYAIVALAVLAIVYQHIARQVDEWLSLPVSDYVCVRIDNTTVRALLADTEDKRARGLREVVGADAVLFIWYEGAPPWVWFTAEGVNQTLYLIHVHGERVSLNVVRVVRVEPGRRYLVSTLTDRDWFIALNPSSVRLPRYASTAEVVPCN